MHCKQATLSAVYESVQSKNSSRFVPVDFLGPYLVRLMYKRLAVHLAVADDILMASFCAVLFPTRCLG